MHSAICDFVKGIIKIEKCLKWAKMLQNFLKCDLQISFVTAYDCVTVWSYSNI
jgi:hypothetical protein